MLRTVKVWLGGFVLAVLGCGLALAGSTPPVNSDADGVAIHGYDPVAYFQDAAPAKGRADFSVHWAGAEWWFANASHRDAFQHAPQHYAPQFGGYCAYAMSLGQYADIDPSAWTVIDGKLYLNYSLRVRVLWRPRAAEFIGDAEQFWKILATPPAEGR